MDCKYVVKTNDFSNGVHYDKFQERIDAESFLHNECLNLDKDKKWWDQNQDALWIEEYKGKLYGHWVYYEHDEYSQVI